MRENMGNRRGTNRGNWRKTLPPTSPTSQIGRCYEVDRYSLLYPEFVMPEADKDTTDFL